MKRAGREVHVTLHRDWARAGDLLRTISQMNQPQEPVTNESFIRHIPGACTGLGVPEAFERSNKMSFEEFENLARLYVVGAMEDGEEEAFLEARKDFGDRAEELIAEFRQLNSVFALSLRPHPPHPDTKRKLLRAILESMHGAGRGDGELGG